MLLDRVIINNYKSYGTENNILDVRPKITTIIGKNGSGKSNIIDYLKYFRPQNLVNLAGINKLKNLNTLDDVLMLNFQLIFDEQEQSEFSNTERTIFKLHSDNIWHFEGGLFNVIKNDSIIIDCKTKLLDLFTQPVFRADMKDRRQILNKDISNLYFDGLVNDKKILLDGLKFINDPQISLTEYQKSIDTLYSRLMYFTNLIPKMFYFDDKMILKDSYTLAEISKIKTNNIDKDNKFLSLLINAFQINIDDLIFSLTTTNPSAARKKKELDINKMLEIKTPEVFNQLTLSGLNLFIGCKDNTLEVYVNNDDIPVFLTERSNGLKWYLSLYLQMKVFDCLDKNTVILIDEPGQSVHIEAQKGILSFFNNISETSQIIYTTHSPFMIDTEDLSRLVLTEKVSGFSKIHNKVHSADLENSSKLETLSPLYQALGFSCSDNIGPSFNKDNIITEGITDYYYLLAYMYYIGIPKEKFPNIIPSTSVDNIHNVASILIGWGCKFKVLVDYDSGGHRALKNLTKLSLQQGKDIFAVKRVPLSSTRPTPNESLTIEKVLIEEKYQNVKENDKLLLAKELYDSAKANTLTLCEESKSNITKLLEQLGIYAES